MNTVEFLTANAERVTDACIQHPHIVVPLLIECIALQRDTIRLQKLLIETQDDGLSDDK